MKTGDRAITAVALGGWGAFIAYFSMASHPAHLAKDFSYPWRAARALLAGQNPYEVMRAVGEYPFNSGLLYPLPAALVASPLANVRPEIAGAIFVGLSSALLAWGLLRDSPYRLPLFLSAPFVQAAILGQWSPLLTAAALMPSLQFLAAAKPTVGLAAWIYNPSRRGIIGGLILVAIAFLVLPGWLGDWLDVASGMNKYRGPATTLLGSFLLLGLLRWRRREGRLFVAMSLIPQLPVFYDSLILWLIPSTLWRSVAFSAVSWVGYLAWYPHHTSPAQNEIAFPWLVFTIYAPALVLLLLLPSREPQAGIGNRESGMGATRDS
ncbi:MAG TPA: hypothetical protein VNM36_11675 [Gemmatimonadaceae bacterium]|nr:hypothetical protein [Gemmatimonadaceae bacterium]